jgi:hypothetical protein
MDISRYILVIDTSILAKSNMSRREYKKLNKNEKRDEYISLLPFSPTDPNRTALAVSSQTTVPLPRPNLTSPLDLLRSVISPVRLLNTPSVLLVFGPNTSGGSDQGDSEAREAETALGDRRTTVKMVTLLPDVLLHPRPLLRFAPCWEIAIWSEELDLTLGFGIDWAGACCPVTATYRSKAKIASREGIRNSEEIYLCFLELTTALFIEPCAGADAGRSVPERADEHVRAEHGEGLRLGHHEAM